MGREVHEVKFDLGQVEELIIADKKDEFVALVKGLPETNGSVMSPFILGELLTRICEHQALDCGAALIAGETGHRIDLNVASFGGMYPLHLAAHNLSLELVKLFLQHGARKNVVNDDQKLPLLVALDALSCLDRFADWTPGITVYKLIYFFCLFEMRKPLEVVKMLSTDTECVQLVANQCVKEGKLVQLAALLMVAREKLLELVPGYESDGSILGIYITKHLATSISKKFELVACGKYKEIGPCLHMRHLMLYATRLLQIFKRIGGIIEEYCFAHPFTSMESHVVAADLTHLFKSSGFLKENELINLICEKLTKEKIVEFDKSVLMKMSSMQCKLANLESKRRNVIGFSPSSQLIDSITSPRSFHTCIKPNTSRSFKLCKPVGTPANGSICQVIDQPITKFKIARHLYRLAVSIKKT